MKKNKKILIIAGGPKVKLDPFQETAKKLNIDVETASFYDINFSSKETVIRIGKKDAASFDLVYLRVVGKRLEEATWLVNYLKQKKVRIVDKVYESSSLYPSTIAKSGEIIKLVNNNIPVPDSLFGSLYYLRDNAERLLGFPFVLKSTTGKKARDVWSPKTKEELAQLIKSLRKREIKGESFFAQKLVTATHRTRVLVVGDEIVGAIVRPTKFRKRFIKKVKGEYPEGRKESLKKVPNKVATLARSAASAAGLEISGIDILEEDKTGKLFVIEANAAPSWKLIAKDTGVNVEERILKYLLRS